MTNPLAIVFGKTRPKQMDLDRPEGCDHDRNTYYYRLVDGVMVLRGIALGPRWETRQMDWRGLSCYKRKEDEQMALITKESGRPEPRADKDEIMAKAKEMIAGGMKVAKAARELGVPDGTLYTWIGKEKKRAEKAKEILESFDAGHIKSMGCIEPELSDKATEVVTAPIGVEVPQYEPSDNDFLDDDFYPPDDEPILRRVAEDKSFDQDAYKLTLIDCIRATANCKSVPSTVVLDYIKAVLGV